MKPELIVMLTHHDETVQDAQTLFEALKDDPIQYWGFKDVGLPHDKMKQLVRTMKDAGKTTFLEVVSLTEKEGLTGAQVAVEGGFDILMGTVYYDSIQQYLQDTPVQYYPFPGKVYGHPSILGGTLEEIVAHACWLESQGVQGLDLLTYRFEGDARRLLQEAVRAVHIPVVSAGSIASFERIAEVCESQAWGFTIGSAFFEHKFVHDDDFCGNVRAVANWLEKTDEQSILKLLDH
jgi:hypothetical protein